MNFKQLADEIDSIIDRDPAARSRLEVVLCYPGFHAMLLYRVSNRLWDWNFKLFARLISHFAKIVTGIEIHPGATIGERFFIDHATGVVIGQTAVIGNDVTLYQGVTLGGTSLHDGKRHPTLEDCVIVGSGAQVLGPITLGVGARVGANAVVLADVPAHATMVGIPAREVVKRAGDEFCAYGTPEDLLDPMLRNVNALNGLVKTMETRIEELEAKLVKKSGPVSKASISRASKAKGSKKAVNQD